MSTRPNARPSARRHAALALAVLLSGCAGPQAALPGVDQNAHAQAPLPPVVVTGHGPGAGAALSAAGRFQFRDTPVADALRLLFTGSGVNLVLADGVQGRVTADFAGLSPEQVFATLLARHGLKVSYQDGTAVVAPETSRTYKLDYVAGDAHKAIWGEIEAQLAALLGPAGRLTVSAMTGTVIVTDTPEVLDRVQTHLAHLEQVVIRQVLIEAKVIEVTLNDDFEMGVDFGAFPRAVGISGTVTGNAGGGNVLSQALTPSTAGFQFGLLGANDFSVLLKALSTQGQVNMLSSPKVSTLNNRPATINVTEQIPVVSREVITGDVAADTRELYEVTFQDAGIQLEVTPQIGADGAMTVLVHPLVTEVSGSVTTPDGLQTLPILNQRETRSVLRVRDGESILMGGFIQNRMREEVAKVPLLGDVPGLGALFRRTVQSHDRVELVILLTPRVMDPERMAGAVRDALADVKHLARPFHLGILHNDRFDPEALHGLSGFATVALPTMPEAGGFAPVTRQGLARHALERGFAALADDNGDGAEQAFATALGIDPNNAEAHFQLALIEAGRGYAGKAMRHFEHIAAQRPEHPWGMNRLGLLLTAAGSFEPASQVLRHALSQFPDHPALLTNLGVAYLGQGIDDLAEVAFRRAQRLYPDAPEPLINHAELLARRGDNTGAVALLSAALPHMADSPEFYLRVQRRMLELAPSPAATEPADGKRA